MIKILVLAGEDFTGLWDAVLDLHDEPQPQRKASAVLQDLVERGLVELYVGEDIALSDPAKLDLEGALAEFSPGPQWDVPAEGDAGPWVYFAATDAGVEWLRKHHWGKTQ